MKKKNKATNMVESVFYSLILTILIISLPLVLGMILTTPDTEVVNIVILVIAVVLEAIIIWMSLLADCINNDTLKEEKEDDI